MAAINTNLQSLNAQRNLATSQSSLSTSMQRLSSGLRVNSAKDDAAGLAIASRMDTQVRGMNVAMRNANDGISMAQTAEGALGNVGNNLQRMRELAVQAANATVTGTDQESLDKEFGELAKEIQRVLSGTKFNNKAILAADSGTQTFQVGANTSAADTIDIATTNMTTLQQITDVAGTNTAGAGRAKLFDDADPANPAKKVVGGAVASTDPTDVTTIHGVIAAIDKAIDKVSSERATLGASQNRFEAVVSNLQQSSEAQSAAKGRIMDADYAVETANLSRSQILQQAGTAMLAQANQLPQQVLSLLR